MKLILTMDEVRRVLMDHAAAMLTAGALYPENAPPENYVMFVHKYSDGSGKTDIETLGRIDRVEILIP